MPERAHWRRVAREAALKQARQRAVPLGGRVDSF